MLRITKLTDYGIVLLTQMANAPAEAVHNARDLAAGSKLPLPMATKILKALARGGILASHRGARGGYLLARPAGAMCGTSCKPSGSRTAPTHRSSV